MQANVCRASSHPGTRLQTSLITAERMWPSRIGPNDETIRSRDCPALTPVSEAYDLRRPHPPECSVRLTCFTAAPPPISPGLSPPNSRSSKHFGPAGSVRLRTKLQIQNWLQRPLPCGLWLHLSSICSQQMRADLASQVYFHIR